MPTPLSPDFQNWSTEQWNQVLVKGAFRGLNVHHLAKANLKENAEITFDKNTNTLSIGKVKVNLDKLQKNTGFSLRRSFCLCVRNKKAKEIDDKMIGFLANKVHEAMQPEITPLKPVVKVPTPIVPVIPQVEEEVVDERTLAFRNAQSIINKAIDQETYYNTGKAMLLSHYEIDCNTGKVIPIHTDLPPKPIPEGPKVSKEEVEEAKRLLETEEGKRFLEEEAAKAHNKHADIYGNKGKLI